MVNDAYKDIDTDELEEELAENSIKIVFNPRRSQWRYEAHYDKLRIPKIEGTWRNSHNAALSEAIDYFKAMR